MFKGNALLIWIIFLLSIFFLPQNSLGIEVSGYTDKGIYVHGDLDVDSSGNVDGYVYTNSGKAIHVEGEIQDKSTIEIDTDSWGGSGYDLDIDSW
jgi:hypothetical protein